MRKVISSGAGYGKEGRFDSGQLSEVDQKLMKIVDGLRTSIRVVGVGGAGGNTVSRLSEMGVEGVETITMNTDAQDLLYSVADKKVLLGAELTGGLGAGSDPSVGENAAKETLSEIGTALQGSDLVFVTCGLGGGTGTGASAVVAEAAKDAGAIALAVVTLPFIVEGTIRAANAKRGFEALKKVADTVIVIPNDKLMEMVPNLPLNSAFRFADEMLSNALKSMTDMIVKPGLMNLDFADLRIVLSNGGTAVIGIGESTSETFTGERSIEAMEEALHCPLLDVNISEADRAIVNVVGGPDMTLQEAQAAVEHLSQRIHPHSNIIWGCQIDESLGKNSVRVMVVISGIKSISQLFAPTGGASGRIADLEVDYI